MRPYKIALICDWFLPKIGGIEINMRDLARNLSTRGHDVEVITAYPGPGIVDGVKVHRLKVPVIPGVGLTYGRSIERKLEAILLQGHFDVIHGHYLLSTLAHFSFYLCRKLNIPTVFTHHSVTAVLHNRPALLVLPWLLSFLGAVLFLKPVRHRSFYPDVVTAVSKAVAVDTGIVFHRKQIPILANGIDPKEWQCEKIPDREFHVASVMRLYSSKHPLRLIRAIPRIDAELPRDLRPVYTIFGDGPLRQRVQAEAARLDLLGRIRLVGFRPRSEIREMFARTKLFVLPSKREGFGIAVLEALAAGIPVVAMNYGGLKDIVQHGRTGYLADGYDEFAAYVAKLILDDGLREKMAGAAPEAAEGFYWDVIIQRHLRVYEKAISMRRASAREI